MRPLRLLVVLVVALICGAAGCGDDDGDDGGGGGGGDDRPSAADQEYIDEAVATFDPEADAPLTEDDARCLASSMVLTVGSERLGEIGIEPEDFAASEEEFPGGLTDDEANDVIDRMEGCVDLPGLFVDSLADDEITPESQECLAEEFDSAFIRRAFLEILTGDAEALAEDSELSEELFGILDECDVFGTG